MAQYAGHVRRRFPPLQQKAEGQNGQRHDRRHTHTLPKGSGSGKKRKAVTSSKMPAVFSTIRGDRQEYRRHLEHHGIKPQSLFLVVSITATSSRQNRRKNNRCSCNTPLARVVGFNPPLIIPIFFVFQNGTRYSINGIFVLHAFYLKLDLIYGMAVISILLHL